MAEIVQLMFNFGVVLYNTSASDVLRLVRSIDTACRHAGVDYSLTFMRNSGEHLDIPGEVTERARIIAFKKNFGFGQGHNEIALSLANATGFYIGLNPDGFLSPWAIAAAKTWQPTSGNVYEFRQDPQEHPKVFDPDSGHTAWVSGAAFLIEMSFFRRLGFDPSFFMYCEDVDLSWRVREQGGTCIMMANALFSHDVSDNRESPETKARMFAGQALLARKWGSATALRTAERRLRKIEAQYNLSKIQLPKMPQSEIRHETPTFCDFGRSGSYSATRW